MGGMRHYPERLSETQEWRPCFKKADQPAKPWTDKEMQKIIENYLILKPRVERIENHEDFIALVSGNKILQKYEGVKQLQAKEKVMQKRQEERAKRMFGKLIK